MKQSLRTHVTFVTDLFNIEEEKEYVINPNCFGDDLAQWLIDRLRLALTKIDPEPTQEDWGWCFSASINQRNFLIGIGAYKDEDTPSTWLVFIESRLSWLSKKLRGQSDDSDLLALARELDRALNSEPRISGIRWHLKENFVRGNEDDWSPHPIKEEL